ncbi:MAG: methyltransferase [Spirochaetes bacterium]|nr:MAG: methyltransferase [Spirochaetota bacterium]
MTSRDLVLTSIAHKEPNRVPVDIGSTPSSGISAVAYKNLMDYMGIDGHTRIYDVVQQLAQPEDWFIERFKIDILDIGRSFNTSDEDWYEITMPNGKKGEYPRWFKPIKQKDGDWYAYDKDGTLIAKMPAGAAFFDQTHFPYIDGYPDNYKDLPKAMSKVLWAALVHSPWDNMDMPDFWDELRKRAIKLRETTDKALMVVAGCNLFEWGTFLRRIDNFLMDLILDQKNVEKLLDALIEQHIPFLEKVCSAVGDVVDIIRFGDDLGMDTGPFMQPEIYKKLFKPRHKMLCDYVKSHSMMHTFIHSCGSISKFIPDLIEVGIEIINPVQTNAKDMEPEKLKKEFGNDVTFWGGGADTRVVLNRGTPEEVKSHVLERLKIFSKGGGFVFNTVHNILPDVPPENILAMFEAIEEFNG